MHEQRDVWVLVLMKKTFCIINLKSQSLIQMGKAKNKILKEAFVDKSKSEI